MAIDPVSLSIAAVSAGSGILQSFGAQQKEIDETRAQNQAAVNKTFSFPYKGEREVMDSRSTEHPNATVISYTS